jgi:FKBP-type peptidyl-prolyl cis-trans isomerase
MSLQLRLIFLVAVVLVAACGKAQDSGEKTAVTQAPAAMEDTETQSDTIAEPVQIAPGLTMRILRQGTGATAEAGQIAIVHYTGWLFDDQAEDKRGQKFDSSVDRGQHFQFPLGAGRVIKGWDQGVVGMREGEIRELTIAPELAYGDRNVGNGLIPPGSTLIFEVELARVQSVKPAVELPGAPK